jgi:hypothetical protein
MKIKCCPLPIDLELAVNHLLDMYKIKSNFYTYHGYIGYFTKNNSYSLTVGRKTITISSNSNLAIAIFLDYTFYENTLTSDLVLYRSHDD